MQLAPPDKHGFRLMHLPCNLYHQRACKNKDQLFHKIKSYNIVCVTTGSPTLPPRIYRLLANYDGRCVNHRLRYDRRTGRRRRGPAPLAGCCGPHAHSLGIIIIIFNARVISEVQRVFKDCIVRFSFLPLLFLLSMEMLMISDC